jgi:hypothetical protein
VQFEPIDEAEGYSAVVRYRLKAWLSYGDRHKPMTRASNPELAATELEPAFVRLIQQAADECGLPDMRVEAIVPLPLLTGEFDLWQVPVGVRKLPIGSRCPAVL